MKPHAVDWFRLLWDLLQRDISLTDIQHKTGISRSTLRGYIDGSHPPHWRGELLIAMWCHVCEKGRDSVPTTEVYIGPRVIPSRSANDNDAFDRLAKAWGTK